MQRVLRITLPSVLEALLLTTCEPIAKFLNPSATNYFLEKMIKGASQVIRYQIPNSGISFQLIAKKITTVHRHPRFFAESNLQPYPLATPSVPDLICFNKPNGVLSQFASEGLWRGLKDFINLRGVYVAGRLDADSEGLLLLTSAS